MGPIAKAVTEATRLDMDEHWAHYLPSDEQSIAAANNRITPGESSNPRGEQRDWYEITWRARKLTTHQARTERARREAILHEIP